MTVYALPQEPHVFPDPEEADPDGLVAVGGDLAPRRLLAAYSQGIFPWYSETTPILWWSPDPRLVLFPRELHVPRSLRRVLNSGRFEITLDADFQSVISACSVTPRPGQYGTWLLPEMIQAYVRLHQMGLAHSVEAWQDGRLVGGLYGVALGRAFFGESMFFREPDASKVALVRLVGYLKSKGFVLLDCQQTTQHMLRFGGREVARRRFLEMLRRAAAQPWPADRWSMPADRS
ncbi:MAG: leucyl/phenylalanyl-tRNA--protein transferase [Desulfovibrionaceae bacterium]